MTGHYLTTIPPGCTCHYTEQRDPYEPHLPSWLDAEPNPDCIVHFPRERPAMTDTTETPTTVTLAANGFTMQVDLPALLTAVDPRMGRYVYDPEDGDEDGERYETTSLADQIVHATAAILAKAMQREVRDAVHGAVHEAVMAEVTTVVRDALENGTLQRTNEWGGKIGDPKPLREVILETAQDALTKPTGDSYSNRRPTVVQKIIADAVGAAFKKELTDAVAQAKAAALRAVQDNAAEVIRETVQRASRGL